MYKENIRYFKGQDFKTKFLKIQFEQPSFVSPFKTIFSEGFED